MSYYLKKLLSEQEKKRILSLHQDRRKSEFRGLIKEAIDPNVQKFFEGLKTTLPGFPKDGYIYEADIDGKPTTVWEVLDTANNLKYYLLQDGTAVDSKGQKSTNKWYTSLPTVTTGTGATGTGATGTGATGTGATGTGATGTGATGTPQKLMGGKELKDLEKQLKQQANQQKKAQKKLTKENVKKCRSTFDTYVKYFGNEERKNKLITDPKGAESFKGYSSEIESCCPIFSKDKRYLPNVQKQGFCTTQTAAGPGYEGFNADSDGNGVPDYLQATGTGATGTGATGTGATGTGATGTGATGTQGAPNAGPQNMPGMSGKSGSGMGRLSAEDQELRDLGLQ